MKLPGKCNIYAGRSSHDACAIMQNFKPLIEAPVYSLLTMACLYAELCSQLIQLFQYVGHWIR